MKTRRAPQPEGKISIANFKLTEVESAPYPTLQLNGICFVASKESYGSARNLFRAIVQCHLWLALREQPLDENESRQRRWLINYDLKEEWQWAEHFLKAATFYRDKALRREHEAWLEIRGHRLYFDQPPRIK